MKVLSKTDRFKKFLDEPSPKNRLSKLVLYFYCAGAGIETFGIIYLYLFLNNNNPGLIGIQRIDAYGAYLGFILSFIGSGFQLVRAHRIRKKLGLNPWFT